MSSTTWGRRQHSRRTASSAICSSSSPGGPDVLGDGLHLVEREWQTDIGPVDLMCRDRDGAWVAVEIKRIATIEAVEQLSRYLERIQTLPGNGRLPGDSRGPASRQAGPHARRVARARAGSRSISRHCAERTEPELTLFSA